MLLEKLPTEQFAYQKTRILNIFIGSEAESSELSPTKNRIENDRLDDEKPSMIVPTYWDTLYFCIFLVENVQKSPVRDIFMCWGAFTRFFDAHNRFFA